jgi:RimJ/RimL family protein N-acetyltransferase
VTPDLLEPNIEPDIEPDIQLVSMDPSQLQKLSKRETVDWGPLRAPEGAMPSHKAIVRALDQWDAGLPAKWCLPYLIVSASRAWIVGACGFKGPPLERSVEIYYGIAPSLRGRGIATGALRQLLSIAVMDDDVGRVLAHILPRNLASRRLVTRMGFQLTQRFMDTDGEDVEQWCWVSR